MTLPWSDPNSNPLADTRAVWDRFVVEPARPSSEDRLRAAVDRAAQQYADLNGFPANTVSTSAGDVPLDQFTTPHVCDYTNGQCRLPGVHGGVPNPEPHEARVEDFTVSGSDIGEAELRCAHWGRGCWWSTYFNTEGLAEVWALAAAHLADVHHAVVEGSVVPHG